MNAHEHSSARLSEIMRRFEDEREERQIEVRSIHQELTTLSEQTKISLEEEASHLWEALHSHNHDIIIEDENSSQVGNVQIQAMADKAAFKSPNKINLNMMREVDARPMGRVRIIRMQTSIRRQLVS